MSKPIQSSAIGNIYQNIQQKIDIFKQKLNELEQKFEMAAGMEKRNCAAECEQLITEFEDMEQIVNNDPGLNDKDRNNLVTNDIISAA